MIEIKGLHKAFGQNQVLKGVDITVNKGDVVVVIGPSGSGKTTMLRCINFLERADAGTIWQVFSDYLSGRISQPFAMLGGLLMPERSQWEILQ